jgi:hypothetical protein
MLLLEKNEGVKEKRVHLEPEQHVSGCYEENQVEFQTN